MKPKKQIEEQLNSFTNKKLWQSPTVEVLNLEKTTADGKAVADADGLRDAS